MVYALEIIIFITIIRPDIWYSGIQELILRRIRKRSTYKYNIAPDLRESKRVRTYKYNIETLDPRLEEVIRYVIKHDLCNKKALCDYMTPNYRKNLLGAQKNQLIKL